MAKKKASRAQNPSATYPEKVVISSPSPSRKVVSVSGSTEPPTFYANNAAVEISNWDVKIRFGQIQSVAPDEIQVKDVFTLYMSHEHGKAFSDALAGVVARLQDLRQQIAVKSESGTKH